MGVYSFNILPDKPSNPSHNNTINITINPVLSWSSNDDNPFDTLTYDVYFGATINPSKIINNQKNTTFNPSPLEYNTTYYWKIVVWDNHGGKTEGPIWKFTTEKYNHLSFSFIPSKINFGRIAIFALNFGYENISDITWSVTIKGGILGKVNITKSGEISDLEPFEPNYIFIKDMSNRRIRGFGRVEITITSEVYNENFKESYRGFMIVGFLYIRYSSKIL